MGFRGRGFKSRRPPALQNSALRSGLRSVANTAAQSSPTPGPFHHLRTAGEYRPRPLQSQIYSGRGLAIGIYCKLQYLIPYKTLVPLPDKAISAADTILK